MEEQPAPKRESVPGFLESLQAGYACLSWFCRERGPFIVKDLEAAERLAEEHRDRHGKWLRLWSHRVVAYRLDTEQLDAGKRLAEYMRRLSAGDVHAGDALREQKNTPGSGEK